MAIKKVSRQAAVFISIFISGAMFAGWAVAQKPTSVEQEFERATQLHKSGDFEGAVRMYLAIL
jgi:hypothetical protein